MANPNGKVENLTHTLTVEEQRLGGINSGIARRKNASIRESLQNILSSGIKMPKINENTKIDKDIINLLEKLKSIGVDTNEIGLVDLMNYGQLLGAVFGKNENYKTLLEVNGENAEETINDTPKLQIEVVDNSNLEKVLYEENKSK